MGMWRTLWHGEEAAPTADFSTLADLIIADAFQSGSYNRKLALSVAAIFRARQINADTIAALPLLTPGEVPVPAPNARQTVQEFNAEYILALEDHGDAYVKLDANGSMHVLANVDVQVRWNDDQTRRIYLSRKTSVPFKTDGMFANMLVSSINRGAGDLTGYGPMESDRIQGIIAEQMYQQQYYENSGAPTGTLNSPGVLTSDEAKTLQEQWIKARTVRTPAVLAGGLTWTQQSFSPQESEWTAGHLVGVGDVATLFGVPGVFLNYSQPGSSRIYENVADVYQGFWRMTLRPTFASRLEAVWAHALRQPVLFDPSELFVESLQHRSMAADALVRVGYDPDDVAEVVGLPTLDHTGIISTQLQPQPEGARI